MPPKKAKGKKGLVKLEHQLLKDDDSRRAAQEAAAQKAKNKFLIEEKNSRLNELKIQNRWREIMRVAKAQDIKTQLEVLQQWHERQMDRKDAGINALERDVAEAEEQYANALQAHLINVDTMIDLQISRLSTLQRQFDGDLATLEEEFDTERSKLQAQHVKEKTDTLGIMARMEHEFQESEADAKHEYQSLRDDVKNKNLEEKHALRIQLEGTVEELWRQFQTALNNYNASTEERKTQFENLKQKDQNSAKVIEQQMKKLTRLQETIAHIKTKLLNNTREYDERNNALREEKEAIQNHFQELKRKMNAFREMEQKKLTELTITSNRVIKDLRAKVEKAGKIIKLAEMNRKLETEEERITPFYESAVDDSAAPKMESIAEKDEEEEKSGAQTDGDLPVPSNKLVPLELPHEHAALNRFYQRYNKVLLDRLALEDQKRALQEENENLRAILKQYLDGISVNEEVLGNLNPLFVVNGRTNAPLYTHGLQQHITYVEAALVYTA